MRLNKRSKTLKIDNIDGVIGALSYNAIRERQTEKTTPIYIGGKHYGDVKLADPEPPRSPYNCPNCCAPIVKDYCEYCGTRFGFTVVKVDGFKKRDEIELLKKTMDGEKTLLFADNKIVAEFHRFGSIANDLGDTPGTTTQYR
jgi:hypothetical protein